MILTDDRDFYINFSKSPMYFSNSDAKFHCDIEFFTNMGSSVYKIKSTDFEIVDFIDNIEIFLQNSTYYPEIFFYFNTPNSSNMEIKCIQLQYGKVENIPVDLGNLDNGLLDNNIYMKLFNYVNEQLIPISTIKVSKSINDFLNSLYEEFLIDDNTGRLYNENLNKFIFLDV